VFVGDTVLLIFIPCVLHS